MKVTSISLYASGDPLGIDLSFRDPTASNPYVVKALAGLDADEIAPVFDGGNFYSMRIPKKEVVLRILLNPDFSNGESYSDLRDDLYRAISYTNFSQVTLVFYNGATAVASISGNIIKFEAPHSSEIPEVQITINCPDPIIRGVSDISVPATGLSSISFSDDVSTAPHGLRLTGTITAVAGINTQARFNGGIGPRAWEFQFGAPQVLIIPPGTDYDIGFDVGDVIHLSSERGNRYFYVERGAGDIQMAGRISANMTWPIVFPGANTIQWDPSATGCTFEFNTIEYVPCYWGV